MTSSTSALNESLSGSVTAGSSFWGGLSGSIAITNISGQSLGDWSFSFVSSYSHFDFYNAQSSAVRNSDGTYTITVRPASWSPPLAAGARLDLGFTVTSDSGPTVTLAEAVMLGGAAAGTGSSSGSATASSTTTPAASTSTATSTSTTTGSASNPSGATATTTGSGGSASSATNTTGTATTTVAGPSTASTTTTSSGSGATGSGSTGATTTTADPGAGAGSPSGLTLEIQLGSSWSGAYEGTLTVRNAGSSSAPAGWSLTFISDHALRNISDFTVRQRTLADGRQEVTLSAPSWAASQALAAGHTLSSYFQASGDRAGQSVAELFSLQASTTTSTTSTSSISASGSTTGVTTSTGSTVDLSGTGSTGTGFNAGGITGSGTTSGVSGGSSTTITGGSSAGGGTTATSGVSSGTSGGTTASGSTSDTAGTVVPGNGTGSTTGSTSVIGSPERTNTPTRLVGYFEEWGLYGRDFRVADVKADQLTHLNYSFFGITPTQGDLPFMARELTVVPGAMVQPGYLGLNSNIPGGLAIHDTWAAYEKPFTQADQLVSRRFDAGQWQGLSAARQQTYLSGDHFDVITQADGSRLVRAKADTWADSQGGIQRLFSKADWDGLSEARRAYLVDHSQQYTWTDQWQGSFSPSGSTTSQRIAAVEAHFAAGAGRTLTLRADGDLLRNSEAWAGDDPGQWQKLYAGNLNQLRSLKQLNPELQIGFAVGGWTLSGNFSTNLDDAAGREIFTQSIVDHLGYYDFFSTVDFDWEYPGGGGLATNASSPQDGAYLALTLQLLDQKLDALKQRTGRSIEISIATPGGAEKLANLNLKGIDPYVDVYNVMTYDFHGGWESRTGHQAAMTGDSGGYDVVTAIDQFRKAGIALDKVVLGAPAYTRAWGGVAAGGGYGYGMAGEALLAPGSVEKGSYDQKDLITGIETNAMDLVWDDTSKAAFAYNASTGLWSSIETTATIAGKAAYVREAGLGGMMVWALSNDSAGPESLVGAAHDALLGGTAFEAIAGRSPGFDHVLGGDGRFSVSDFTSLA